MTHSNNNTGANRQETPYEKFVKSRKTGQDSSLEEFQRLSALAKRETKGVFITAGGIVTTEVPTGAERRSLQEQYAKCDD